MVISMIAFDTEIKVPDTEIFPKHAMADLNSYCFTQSGEAFKVKGNTDTQTHRHTDTHTHTHTHTQGIKIIQAPSVINYLS